MTLADAEARRKRGHFQKAINRKLQDLANHPYDFKLRTRIDWAFYGLVKTLASTVGATLKASQLIRVQTTRRVRKELRRLSEQLRTLVGKTQPESASHAAVKRSLRALRTTLRAPLASRQEHPSCGRSWRKPADSSTGRMSSSTASITANTRKLTSPIASGDRLFTRDSCR